MRTRDQERIIDGIADEIADGKLPECRECDEKMYAYDDSLYRCKKCGWSITVEDYQLMLEDNVFNQEE